MFIGVNDEFKEINKWHKSYKFERTSKMHFKMTYVYLKSNKY
jgi:hypothetical protein